eukprot:gene14975-20146_t
MMPRIGSKSSVTIPANDEEKEIPQAKKFLKNSRYDLSKYQEVTSYDFFDAFTNSAPTVAARTKNRISTGLNLDKYLSITGRVTTSEFKKIELSNSIKYSNSKSLHLTGGKLPVELEELLALQQTNGKFEDLVHVMTCLYIPLHVKFKQDDLLYDWQKATALAVAAMRQNYNLFDLLGDAHDRAEQRITRELLLEARDLLFQYQYSETWPDDDKNNHTLVANEDNDVDYDDPEIQLAERYNKIALKPITADAFLSSTFSSTLETERDMKSKPSTPNQSVSSPTYRGESIVSDESSLLKQTLLSMTAMKDEGRIKEETQNLMRIEQHIVQLCIEIEGLVKEIKLCHEESVKAYISSDFFTTRNRTFDELTSRLGDGAMPIEGLQDWRSVGAPGLRPKMIEFFNQIQNMAEKRLLIEELNLPEGRGLKSVSNQLRSSNEDINLKRWTLIWNGQDVVLKIIH